MSLLLGMATRVVVVSEGRVAVMMRGMREVRMVVGGSGECLGRFPGVVLVRRTAVCIIKGGRGRMGFGTGVWWSNEVWLLSSNGYQSIVVAVRGGGRS